MLGLRAEQNAPQLYANFEWLAQRAKDFWHEWDQHPPQWQPIARREPTPDDRAVFEAFDRTTTREPAGWALLQDLHRRAPTFETFRQLVPDGSPAFVTFDWWVCAYDRAGVLVKNGIVHPGLLLDAWESPRRVWEMIGVWVRGLQQARNDPHVYENAEWLAVFEQQWRLNSAANL